MNVILDAIFAETEFYLNGLLVKIQTFVKTKIAIFVKLLDIVINVNWDIIRLMVNAQAVI